MSNKINSFFNYDVKLSSGKNITIYRVAEVSYTNWSELLLFANIFVLCLSFTLYALNQIILYFLFFLFLTFFNIKNLKTYVKKLNHLSNFININAKIKSLWIEEYNIKGAHIACLKINYKYNYNNEQYISENISIFENQLCSYKLDKIITWADEFQNETIETWLNPYKPEESVLMKHPNKKVQYIYHANKIFMLLHIGIVLLLLIGWLI